MKIRKMLGFTVHLPSRCRRHYGICLAGMLGILSASCAEPLSSLTVPLEYTPTDTTSNSITLPAGQGKLYILPVDDQRPTSDKNKIGENQEDPAKPIPIVSGTPLASDWVHDTLQQIFKQNGINTVSSADEADLLLSVTLTNFATKETSVYNAQMSAVLKVQDKTGKVLYTGIITGQDATSGKGLSVENYRKVFSNALYNATSKLMENADFEKALVPPTAGGEPEAPPPPPAR